MPEVGTPLDPLDAQFFQLEITGLPPKTFHHVTMPAVEVQMDRSVETGANGQPVVRRSVGRPSQGEITAQGGVTSDMTLETWLKNVMEKGIGASAAENEKEATLTAYDTSTALLASWKLVGCVIKGLEYDGMSMGGGGHLGFTATFDVLSIERTK